jgi:hypothetical protein
MTQSITCPSCGYHISPPVDPELAERRAHNAERWRECITRLGDDRPSKPSPRTRGRARRQEFDRACLWLRANPGERVVSEDFSDEDTRIGMDSDGGMMQYCRKCDGLSWPNRPCACF